MPKKAYIADHLSISELATRYKKCQDPVESRRWHLLWRIASGLTIQASALIVGVHYQYGKKVLKKYNEEEKRG